jgi:hypothetical protein
MAEYSQGPDPGLFMIKTALRFLPKLQNKYITFMMLLTLSYGSDTVPLVDRHPPRKNQV